MNSAWVVAKSRRRFHWNQFYRKRAKLIKRNGQSFQEISTHIVGWIGYHRQTNMPSIYEELDGWIRWRLRQMIWNRWKRGTTRFREPVRLGVPKWRAGLGALGNSPRRMSTSPLIQEVLNNGYFHNVGLKRIKNRYQ